MRPKRAGASEVGRKLRPLVARLAWGRLLVGSPVPEHVESFATSSYETAELGVACGLALC